MTRWNLSIPDETDRRVRIYLARIGMKKGDLSRFVVDAVRAELLRRTVLLVQEENAGLSSDEAMKIAEESVAWTRAHPPR